MNDAVTLAEKFNRECGCTATDVPALRQRLGLGVETHEHLFANMPVFLAAEHARDMQRVVSAVEAVTRLPAFRDQVLARAPEIARPAPKSRGVFFGFDFHITPDGPKLIEINTNAGGALLNIELQREQQACCAPIADFLRAAPSANTRERDIVAMFESEWRLARGSQPLRTIAIVDDAPREQYLYSEFLLFKKLFEAHGFEAVIADARELSVEQGVLTWNGHRIDLVYNRCTDFYFADTLHAALAEAYRRDLAVITPHPHAHALYSDKSNLVLLSDPAALRALGAAEADVAVLARAIPRTVHVTGPQHQWWEERRNWFFKPVHGFGSRGTYRGDKITRRVLENVMHGVYVAQALSPPSERRQGTSATRLKLDIRSYAYEGVQQLLAARLYQGQTTNFRTAGGGFAAVYELSPDVTETDLISRCGSETPEPAPAPAPAPARE
jgi:hypothetical protein